MSTKHPESATVISLVAPTLIGLYLLLTSTRALIPGIWPYDAKRILQFALLFILFLIPLVNRSVRAEFGALVSDMPAWLRMTALTLFGWGVASAMLNAQSGMHLANSLSEVALLSSLVLAACIVAACRRIAGRRFDRIAIGLIALTGLAVGAQELLGVAAAHHAGVEFNFRVSLLHFSWPRFYNQVQSWVIPALVALPILFARYRLAYVLCFIVLGLHWYIILMTGARGSFVAITAAIFFALVFLSPVRRRLLSWQSTGFALGTLIFAAVMFSFESGEQAGADGSDLQTKQHERIREADREAGGTALSGGESSFFKQSLGRPMVHTSGRTWMWTVTIRDAREHPLFGIGPMNYVCTRPERIGHPHNFPLQLAAEWGIPAALAVSAVFLILLYRVSRRIRLDRYSNPEDTALAGLLLTGILAAALHACLSGVMVMPASQVTGLLICGMLLGLRPAGQTESATSTWRWSFVPGLALTLGLLILGAHELRTMESRAERLSPADSMYPRIWQDSRVCRFYTR